MDKDNNAHAYVSDAVAKQLDNTICFDAHYQAMPLQPIEVMQALLSYDELLGYLKGNTIKYCMRAGHKQGESANKDYAKAMRYKAWLKQMQNDPTAKIDPCK